MVREWVNDKPRGNATFLLPCGSVFRGRRKGDVLGTLIANSGKHVLKS
jgi:hypothetical protein